MKPVSPEWLTMLKTRQYFAVDLWDVKFVGGTTLHYCSGDADVTANGITYSAGGQTGPYWDRTDNKAKCHWAVGTKVDTLVVDVIPGSSTVLGAPFLTAVRLGAFDAAEITLWRAFMPTYGDTTRGVMHYFGGRVGEIDASRSIATFSINSHLELLNLQFPRNLVQAGCMNSLGDATCQALVPQTSGVITQTSTNGTLYASLAGGPYAAGAFDKGKATFLTGALAGYSYTVKQCLFGTPNVISMLGFLPSVPSVGDTFNIFYGCNKSLTDSNGCPKFANTVHFRGFPFVPQPPTAV